VVAHIAGIPVEETALSLAPIAAATGGIAGLKLRERVRRRTRPGPHAGAGHPPGPGLWRRRRERR
jgi:hypothetical protein